jgi:uncharacterized Ntn-hydrolase superfamily protein
MKSILKSISTFSLVARASNGDLGVAVASKFLAVGSAVPWVTGGIGAVATQSYANTSYGPRALNAMANGIKIRSPRSNPRFQFQLTLP